MKAGIQREEVFSSTARKILYIPTYLPMHLGGNVFRPLDQRSTERIYSCDHEHFLFATFSKSEVFFFFPTSPPSEALLHASHSLDGSTLGRKGAFVYIFRDFGSLMGIHTQNSIDLYSLLG